ncbi:hypothetical protein Tco_0104801, partial [Tanacetum coccineum]
MPSMATVESKNIQLAGSIKQQANEAFKGYYRHGATYLAMRKFKEALKDFQQKLCREALRMLQGTHFGGQTFRHSWGHSPAIKQSKASRMVDTMTMDKDMNFTNMLKLLETLICTMKTTQRSWPPTRGDSKGNGRWDGVKKTDENRVLDLNVIEYQSGRSKSWEKPIHNRMQKGFEKGYLFREGATNTLPRSSQKKQLSHECKEMLWRKLNEIKAYNASKGRAAVKEKGEGSVNTTKEKKARCYICRKRGHVFLMSPNNKNPTTLEAPTIDNQSKEATMVRNDERLKYPKNVHVKTDYMIEGTDFSNWDNIWYVSSAYKKHMTLTKSLFKRLKNSFKVEGTQQERKIIFSHGIREAMAET